MKPGIDYIAITTPFYCHDGNGHLLMHKRSKQCRDEQGMWDPGGGKLEFGQSLEESVLREVREEYGCEGTIEETLPAHSVIRTFDGVTTHWVAIPFIIRVDRATVKNNDPDKIDELGWFTLDALPSPLHTGFVFSFGLFGDIFRNAITVPAAKKGSQQ